MFLRHRLSIRAQLLLLVLGIALPAVAIVAHYVVHDSQEASEAAYVKVKDLVDETRSVLDQMVREQETVLRQFAARPRVRALDPRDCDPVIGEYVRPYPKFTTLAVRDAQGNLVCSSDPSPPTQAQMSGLAWFREGIRSGAFAVSDAFVGPTSGRWVSVLTYPIRDDQGKVSGLILLGVDLVQLNERLFLRSPKNAVQFVLDGDNKFLLRSIDFAEWIGKPLPGSQAETIRDRHADSFSTPGSDGVQRLYAVETVPGTKWRVVVGLPEDEVFAEYRERLARVAVIGTVVLLLVLALAWRIGAAIAAPIRELATTAARISGGDAAARARVAGPAEIEYVAQEFNRMLDVQDRHREERAALVGHYEQLVRLARDVFLLIDPSGNIVEANSAAAAAYGYSEDALRHLNLRDLRAPESQAVLEEHWQASGRPGGALFETVHRRKDGSTFAVEVSSQTIDIDGKPYRQSFIRDISERHTAEAQIRRLNSAYATLSQTNEAIVRLHDVNELFSRICRIAVEFGGYAGACVGLVDEKHRRIVPAAIDGSIDGYVRKIEISTDPTQPEGRGPAALALREGKPYYCQDFLQDPATEPWHALAAQFGVRSVAALPLRRAGAVIGTLNLYSAEPGVFDGQTRALLEEMATDITFALDNFEREAARRQAEAALARSEVYYRGLFENMQEGLAYCRMILENGQPRDFVYLSVNESFERLTGLKNVVGRKVTELIPGIRESNPELFEVYGRAASTGRPEVMETYLPALNIWFSISVYSPEPGHFVAVFDNITERKETEQALREGEARLRSIIDTAQDAFLLVGAQGELLDTNNAASELSGYSREQLLQMTLHDLEAVESDEEIERTIAEVLAAGHARFERTWKHKDGKLLYIEISTTHMGEDRGGYFFTFVHNITQRKQTEQALREGAERFRAMLEQNISAMFIVEDDVLTYANRRATEILGYSTEELIGRPILDLVVEPDRPNIAAAMRQLLSGELKSAERNFGARRKDGTVADIGAHAILATLQGRKAVLGIAQDIGERRKAQAEIERYIGRLEHAMQSTLTAVSLMVELRDPYTAGHERRVGELAAAIGTEMGLPDDTVKGLRLAGYVHDIGKISVPAEILSKPTRLTPIEFELIRGHSLSGYDILKGVDFPWPLAEVILQHHERLDGSGYPRQLRDGAIILEARIMAVADVVEAMSSHRPYRPGLGMDAALEEIARNGGTFYDPQVVAACLCLFRDKAYALPA